MNAAPRHLLPQLVRDALHQGTECLGAPHIPKGQRASPHEPARARVPHDQPPAAVRMHGHMEEAVPDVVFRHEGRRLHHMSHVPRRRQAEGRRRHVLVRAARVVVAQSPLSALLHDHPRVDDRRSCHLLDHSLGHMLHRAEQQVSVRLRDRLSQVLVGLPRVERMVSRRRLVHRLDPQTVTHRRDHAGWQPRVLPIDRARVDRQKGPHPDPLLVLGIQASISRVHRRLHHVQIHREAGASAPPSACRPPLHSVRQAGWRRPVSQRRLAAVRPPRQHEAGPR